MKAKNKIITSIKVLLLALLLSSCNDVLDVTPSDKVNISRLLNKEQQIRNFRDNCYKNLNSNFTKHSSGELLEAFSDDAFRAGTGNAYKWHNEQLSIMETFMGKSIWFDCWEGIRKCNLAIQYIPQSTVTKDKLDDATLSMLTDEAKLIRAWYHFDLIKNFGPIPFVDEAFEPDFTGWNDLKRPTYHEISKRIVQECEEVIKGGRLPLRYQTSSEYDLVNMATAYALKSRVLLYNASLLNNPNGDIQKWKDAAQAAQECVDGIKSECNLVDINSYHTLFSQSYTNKIPEIILASRVNSEKVLNENNGVDLDLLGSVKQSSNCGSVPTQELVDCFELKDGTLPVASYLNANHTMVTYNNGYNENEGSDIYSNRDLRFYESIVFNGANYGRLPTQTKLSPDLTIYTYEGKVGTGYNANFTSTVEDDRRRSCTGYYGKKFRTASYWGSKVGGTSSHKIYFRLAEVYLNLAEANCEAGDLDAAKTALNVIRERALQPAIENVPDFENTKEYILNRIRNERRVELCFEGHRFYDQRRWKILEETNDVISGMKIISKNDDDGPFTYQRVKIDVPRNATSEKYLVLPILSEEARRLTGLGQPEAWK